MKRGVLYISYDGMLEPLGQSQVLAYLEELAKRRPIHLISFEKRSDWIRRADLALLRRRIGSSGIKWYPIRYHRWPSAVATAWDIMAGTVVAAIVMLRFSIGIVHSRSYVASVIAWGLTRFGSASFLFDMRGFWADERIDGGLWRQGSPVFRVAKWFEKRFLLDADHVVSLTHAGVKAMQDFGYLGHRASWVSVIPTCVDLDLFQPKSTRQGVFVLGYVGSAGTWYLFERFVECFCRLRELRPDARLLVINRGEHQLIRGSLDAAGVPPGVVELLSVSHRDIPEQMARMHAAAFFIKPVFSKSASAPTKLGELLSCGVPCLVNTGVGDMAGILENERVGVAVRDFDPESMETGVEDLLRLADEAGIKDRCRLAAERHFSLADGAERYAAIYDRLDQTHESKY